MGRLNNWVGVGMQLSQFETRSYLLAGRSGGNAQRFWKSLERSTHPFFGSRLLREHGMTLADLTYADGERRAETIGMAKKGANSHDRQLLDSVKALHALETPRRRELEMLVSTIVSTEWGIPLEQLTPTLRESTLPGLMLPGHKASSHPREWLTANLAAAGWSRIAFSETGPAMVEAVALVFPLLRHELVKGVAELCCAHGLASLDDETYQAVIEETDKIWLERPGMQVGPTLYRNWRESLPTGVTPAAGLTHMSLADPDVVETVLLAVVEDSQAATEILTHLCRDSIIELE